MSRAVNPLYTMSLQSKPTSDELKVISLLNQAVTKALKCTCIFDVFDEQDAEEMEETRLAQQYGNACNTFLRSAACAYQAVILHQDCTTGEPIDLQLCTEKQAISTCESPTHYSPTNLASASTTTERKDLATSDSLSTAPDTDANTGRPIAPTTTTGTEEGQIAVNSTTVTRHKTPSDQSTSVPTDCTTESTTSTSKPPTG